MTISEIAEKAGVSSATVSRVINGKGHVKESTRKLILDIIRQNEYVPSEIARGLSKSDSNNIGVFVADIENAFFYKAVRGMIEQADLYGYNVFLFDTDEDIDKQHRYLQTVMGLRIKGLIITPVLESNDETRTRLKKMQEKGIPVVLLDRDVSGLELDGVFSEDEEGAYQAVRALIQAGHRDIAIITGPEYTRPGRMRTAGYMRAMREFNIPVREEYVQIGDFRTENSFECTNVLMDLPQPPTAIFSVNNLTTIGCLKCLSQRGLKVGEDISVIGFDDLDYLNALGVSLSTVDRSFVDMGRQAMELLRQRLQEEDSDAPHASQTRIYQKPMLNLCGSEKWKGATKP